MEKTEIIKSYLAKHPDEFFLVVDCFKNGIRGYFMKENTNEITHSLDAWGEIQECTFVHEIIQKQINARLRFSEHGKTEYIIK